jgi:hypothetical protein
LREESRWLIVRAGKLVEELEEAQFLHKLSPDFAIEFSKVLKKDEPE